MLKPVLLCALALAVAAPLRAQAPLTLAEAFRRADSAAPTASPAASAGPRRPGHRRPSGHPPDGPRRGRLRPDRQSAGRLRLHAAAAGVSIASFNPASLNYPSAVTNWSGGLVAELPLINADAWFGRAAASSAARPRCRRRLDPRDHPGRRDPRLLRCGPRPRTGPHARGRLAAARATCGRPSRWSPTGWRPGPTPCSPRCRLAKPRPG